MAVSFVGVRNLVAGFALAAFAVALLPGEAAAQFVCTGTGAQAAGGAGGSTAGGAGSVACGVTSNANGAHSVAIGDTAAAGSAIAVTNYAANPGGFPGSGSTNTGNVAIGPGASAATNLGGSGIAIGSRATTSGSGGDQLAIGTDAYATGPDSTAIGGQTRASAANGIAIGGNYTDNAGANSTVIGVASTATAAAANSVVLGTNSNATVANSVLLGNGTSVTASGGVALGFGASAGRAGLAGTAEAFSGTAVASTNGAVSVGTAGGERQITNVAGGTQATDAVNVRQLGGVGSNVAAALGSGARFDPATGAFTAPSYTVAGTNYNSVGSAIAALNAGSAGAGAAPTGFQANNSGNATGPNAAGANAVAGGYGASAAGAQATALGPNANAAGANSVAIGSGSSAQQANALALGTDTTTTRANQVAIGSAGQTFTLAGLGSAQSRAAQSGATTFVTTDASGNLAASSFGPAQLAALDGRVGSLEAGLSAVGRYAAQARREARQGVAAAMAISSAPLPSAPGKVSYVGNISTFRGEVAGGGSIAYRLDTALPVALTAGASGSGGGNVGVRIGIMGEL